MLFALAQLVQWRIAMTASTGGFCDSRFVALSRLVNCQRLQVAKPDVLIVLRDARS
jgi:hypothetical protein